MTYRILKFDPDNREAELEFFSSAGNFLCYAWGYETAEAIILTVFTLLLAADIFHSIAHESIYKNERDTFCAPFSFY